jgi:hypothetical protein
MTGMNGTWSSWFRDSFDKLLLFITFLITVGVVLHMVHDSKDMDEILWAREMAGTVLGALLGLITGHALASSKATTVTSEGARTVLSTEGKS